MVVREERRYLTAYLCREEGHRDTIVIDIVVERSQVHTNVLSQYMECGSRKQCRVDVNHVGIEAEVGVASYNILLCHLQFLLIPMGIVHDTVMLQHTALGHTCRTRGVEDDSRIVCFCRHSHSILYCRQLPQVAVREYDSVKIRENSIGKILVSEYNLHTRILTHEHQTVFRELTIKWHIGTSSLHHRHGINQY